MKYIEVVDKQEVLKIISDCIETMKKNHVPVPPAFPEIYYEISQLKTSGHFEMDTDDSVEWDPFYIPPQNNKYRPC